MRTARPVRRFRLVLLLHVLIAALLPLSALSAGEAPALSVAGPVRATGLSANHAQGQTFLVWAVPPGSGWRYRVYRSANPLLAEADLATATLYAELGDSSALDVRLSRITGVLYGHVVHESPRRELEPGQGLCVVTPAAGLAYYAVTSQAAGQPEDRLLVAGDNSLAIPVTESLDTPVPVRQRDLAFNGRTVAVYTLFASHLDTPLFPAMANRAGVAFDCGIVQEVAGPAPGPLLLMPHARGGKFLDGAVGTRYPGEYVLALDDPLPNGENTFWYGYHPGYDVTRRDNQPPTSGAVVDYTFRRVRHTVDWALRAFPVDPDRVYAFGYSMGGIGSMEFAMWLPGRIAAVMTVLGKFDFSFLSEPDPTAWFNPTSNMRKTTDQMWGTVASGLTQPDGTPVYQQLNLSSLVTQAGPRDVPPVVAVNGKRDNVVGWAEKFSFYAAMRDTRRGGAFFWDANDHYGQHGPRLWQPMVDPASLYRFRRNVSYPGFTHCDLDAMPGDGTFASGDTVGCINGHLDWYEYPTDLPSVWQCIVSTRSLATALGTIAAPESCRADVTPNRVQRFRLPVGVRVPYKVYRQSDWALVQSGFSITDALGRPTVPQALIYRTGSVVMFGPIATLDAGAGQPGRRLSLALATNPVRGVLRFSVRWPEGTPGRVVLMDIAGRQVRPIYAGARPPGAEVSVPLGGLAPGLYLLHASAGGEYATQRVVVIH